jgi:maltooligosyltrehalose trehalohydrolase
MPGSNIHPTTPPTSEDRSLLRREDEARNSLREAPHNLVAESPQVQREVTFVYDAGPHSPLSNLQLKGSWEVATGRYSAHWDERSIPMTHDGHGLWKATLSLLDDGPHDWQWGVLADGPSGQARWAVMGEGNLRFDPKQPQVLYAPTRYHRLGAHRVNGTDVHFQFWAPHALNVQVKVMDERGDVQRFSLERDAEGYWSTSVPGAWERLVGKAYVYEVVDSTGATLERPDPYARQMMGEQRGVSRLYLHPLTGQQTHRYASERLELLRFELDDEDNVERAYLVLKDASGRPLSRDELLKRFGSFEASLIRRLHEGRLNDLWSENHEPDGRIRMLEQGGSYITLLSHPEKAFGLRYELQVWERDAKGKLRLRDDPDRDGKLSDSERRASPNNDRWSDVLTPASGVSFRNSLITDTAWPWKHDDAPRERDPRRWVVYQLHIGSFLGRGRNANRSTLEDVLQRLDYFQTLGVNALELLPVNEVEGNRDWGYMGANSLSAESSLGFEDEQGRWVSGTEALKRFIDEAHQRGLNVIGDVVYNHIHGDYNMLWNLDGPENPYFNWSPNPSRLELRNTDWGAMPAYHRPQVRQFFVDHAVAQVRELHFDGLRFDFTEPIKHTGGKAGWDMLREINRQLHFLRPGVYTVAEQFPYDPSMTRPALSDGTGCGFDAQWYTEFQHRLVYDHERSRPGLIQAAAHGERTDVDAFMNLLTSPLGMDEWRKSLTMLSNHDEVGNAQRTLRTAQGKETSRFPSQWARGATRLAAGIAFTSPGTPMFFQGDESMARNDFRWGITSTWDLGWEWLRLGEHWDWEQLAFDDTRKALYERLFPLSPAEREKSPEYQGLSAADRRVFEELAKLPAAGREQAMLDITRRQCFRFYQDALRLRRGSPAFRADAEVVRVHTHNDDSTLAYLRRAEGEEYLVVASLNRHPLAGYRMPLPPGRWKEVLNSDSARYGGMDFGNFGATLEGGPETRLNLPAAGCLVFQRV